MSSTLEIPHHLAVVDDDPDSGGALQRRLERRGFDVAIVMPSSPAIADTVKAVRSVSGAALCDHRLKDGMKVNFSGADLVAELTDQKFPAVLFTGVQPEDRYAIRRSLDRIPGYLRRDEEGGLLAPRLLNALQESVDEVLNDAPSARRRARRTPVTVVRSRRTGGRAIFEIRVSGLLEPGVIEVPADVFPSPWSARPGDAEGKTFFAWANLGESDMERVFLRNVEPEPLRTNSFLDSLEA